MNIDDFMDVDAGVVPPRPTISAQTAAAHTADYEDLVASEQHEDTLWEQVARMRAQVRHVAESLKTLATRSTGVIKRVDLMEQSILLDAALGNSDRAVDTVRNTSREIRRNQRVMNNSAVDVLIHRPAHHALLAPDEPVRVSTDTPTLGPKISDEAMLLRGKGLNLSGQ
jgi:hypothetical protein